MAVSGKYGKIIVENDSAEHPLNNTDEPVFLVRARDASAIVTLVMYRHGRSSEGAAIDIGMAREIERFRAWQKANSALVKEPD